MRKLVALFATTAMVGGLALVAAGPAGADVSAGGKKPSKFCKALGKFDSEQIGNPTTEKGAARISKQLKKLEKKAKGDTKEAIGELIDFYDQVADGESPREVFADGDFIEASGTFATASLDCLSTNITLPDITLPDIDLPDITLPDLGGN